MKIILTFLLATSFYYCFSQPQPTNCLSYTYASYGAIDFTTDQYGAAQFFDPATMSPKISYKKASATTISDPKYPPFNGDEACNSGMTTTTCNVVDSDLTYVVYYPTSLINGATTKGCLFPAIILFHGGGFDDCGKADIAKANIGLGPIAQAFARKGYVVYVVEYRTGRYVDPYGIFVSAQQSLAEYRSFQDGRGSIRSIIWHQRRTADFPNDPYQIDTTRIFVGGNSAGSIIALQAAYYNAAQIAAIFPTPALQPTIATALGPIDIDYYIGTPDINYRSQIKGVINMWGQMFFPTKYYNASTNTYHLQDFWADYGNAIIPPMIAFHGYKDSTLPIKITNITFAPDKSVTFIDNDGIQRTVNYTPLNSETHCLLNSPIAYKLDGDETSFDLIGAGSKGMYDIFHTSAINQRIELHVDCDMEHGLDNDCTGCGGNPAHKFTKTKTGCDNCVFASDYGTGLTNSADVNLYMVERTATYFQAILTSQVTNLGNDIFIECENKRVKSYVSTVPHNAPVTTNNPASCNTANCSFP